MPVPEGEGAAVEKTARRAGAGAGAGAAELAAELSLTIGRLLRMARRHSAGRGLPRPLVSVLAALEAEGPLCPSELAAAEGVTRASITPVLARGEQLGLLARKPHPDDHRQHYVELTRRGRATLARERESKSAWLAKRLAQLPAADRAAIEAALPALRRITVR
jgi:DNA-binding MarR family transcriptional regulator